MMRQSLDRILHRQSAPSLSLPQIKNKRVQTMKNRKQLKPRQSIFQQKTKQLLAGKLRKKSSKHNSDKIDIKSKQQKQKLNISAKSYAIYNQASDPLIQFNSKQKRQIASLTKLMTMVVSLRLSEKFQVKINNTYFRASANACNIQGTIAEIDPKQWITVEDLLYGLMLPSGNDAALILAQNFGAFLFYQKKGELKALKEIKSLDITGDSMNLKLYMQNFVRYMNQTAKQLQMIDTNFVNPHGLDCKQNLSTVQDLGKLLKYISKMEMASKIISTKYYFARLKNSIGKKQTSYRQIDWINTHRLLWKEGYKGGKTGQTVAAGNCLATLYKNEGYQYNIIVLGCQQKQDRFSQTQKLVKKVILKIQ